MEIIPAIMPRTFGELEEKTGLVKGLARLVQVDIMDGRLTKHSGWPYKKMPDPYFEALRNESRGLPFWEEMDYEFDLMVLNPEEIVKDFVSAGASRIIVHMETVSDWQKVVAGLKGSVEIGIAIGVAAPHDALEPFIADADFIQCMGIARLGFQGEPFDERVLDKIREIKKRYPGKIVSVEGGVSLDTAPRLLEAGADRLVAGSAIFENGDIAEAIEGFKQLSI